MGTLLVELIEELSRAHTVATFTQATLRALARHLAIVSLELVLDGAARSPKCFEAGATPAANNVRGPVCAIPLRVDGVDVGRATVVLAPGASPLSPPLVEDIGRVLSAALRQLSALARVAGVSRRAHARSRELGETSGHEFYDRLLARAVDQAARVLFISGMGASDDPFGLATRHRHLMKPMPADLLRLRIE